MGSADVDPVTATTWRQTNSPSRAKYQGQLHPSPSLEKSLGKNCRSSVRFQMSLSLPAPLYPLVHVLVATVHRTTGTRGNRKEKKERKLEILKVVITFKPFLILAISRDKCSSSSSSKEKFAELRRRSKVSASSLKGIH